MWCEPCSSLTAYVSTVFAAEIFRPERFQNSDQVTSYLGLAPMVRQSGEQKGHGKLPPVGQRRLRSLLIEAAWSWIGKDTSAREFYKRILGRTGLSQKAIVAVARKLAVRLWYRSLGVPLAVNVS
jgi:transposase